MVKRGLCNAGVGVGGIYVWLGGQRLVLQRREHSHPRALRPVLSSRDHLQVPRAFSAGRYRPNARASLKLPLCAVDVGGPVTTEC